MRSFEEKPDAETAAEYLGVLLVVAAIITAIAWTDPGQAISGKLSAPGLTTRIGGFTPTEEAINHEVTSDIGRAEGPRLEALELASSP